VDCNHEKEGFEVDPVALHIHERILARAQKSQREIGATGFVPP
jgi:hypothetical protein